MKTVRSDAELLRSYVVDGDGDAFAELVRRHLGMVYHAALRQTGGDTHGAQDISQAVFAVLARKGRGLMRHTSLAGWLHTTTRLTARAALRAARRRIAREQEAVFMHALSADEDSGAGWEKLRPVIDDALGELGAGDRDAVLLRFFAGLPFAVVGTRLGVSENTARMRVERALDKLHLRLARRGITSTTTALGMALANEAVAASSVPADLAASVASTALAGGAGGSSAGLGFVFMSMQKWIGGLVALAIAAGIVGVGRHELVAEAVARAQHDETIRRAGMRAAQERAMAAAEELARLQQRMEAALAARTKHAASANASAPRSPQAASAPDPVAEGWAFLARHPEVKQALDEYALANFRFQYAPLIRELGLTPEQVREFAALARGGTMGAESFSGKPLALPFGNDTPWSADSAARLRALLGDDGYKRWTQYRSTIPGRRIAAETASALYFTDTPLTSRQADALVDIIATSRLPRSVSSTGGHDWDAILAKAQTVLSAPQIEVLAARQASEQFSAILTAKLYGK